MQEIELTTPINAPFSQEKIEKIVSARFARTDLRCVVTKRSHDLRKDPIYRYRVEVYTPDEQIQEYSLPQYRDVHNAQSVIVVGAGPAGMFAALRLLMEGFKPIILERGKDVHERKRDMAALSKDGLLDPDSNYCFGEGGAGTFSDGKLFTRSSKRGDNREVLQQLVNFGADASILTDSHPHLGTDRLPAIVENIRHCIVQHGGEYHFGARVVDIASAEESGINVRCANSATYSAGAVVLASGHSARDIYDMLLSKGGELQAKGFALGVRTEHPQRTINHSQYHGHFKPGMPAAEYSFVEQVDGRGVFSFCMCPGGILVPSSTEEGTVVLNGMSNSARNSKWANAGVVVQIEPEDVPGDSPMRLMDFQQEVERNMYRYMQEQRESGEIHRYAAPAQRMQDFCAGKLSKTIPESSYHPGAVSAPLHELLPGQVAHRLQQAFPKVRIKGYYTNEALLLGVESRTSSPVRIPRDPQTLEYTSIPGIFPAGEGAGYSGGIVSSAIDGIRAAQAAARSLEHREE